MGKLIRGPWSVDDNETQSLWNTSEDLEFVALDVETTGFNKNDKIIELALLVFKNGQILEEWSTLINPQRDLGKTNIHGITSSMVSTAPIFDELTNDIFRLINNRVIVAHNLSFDVRMLMNELNRTKTQGDLGKGFCTMIASRNLLPGTGDSLQQTCSTLSIEILNAHSALGDAKMTMQVFEYLKEDGQKVSPAKFEYEIGRIPVRTIERIAFKREKDDAIERIKHFTNKVPFPTSEEKFVAYLLLLNMAMQDLLISKEEEAELLHWANDLGISKSEVEELHQGYLESFIQAALRDGVLTKQEVEMIEMVGKALKLPVIIPDVPQAITANAENLSVGKRVCFTGEAYGISGGSISRSDLEALAAKVGLYPVKDVTKKGCDFLVAADELTMSGKAKRAKEWGIPIISVEKFITYCTFGK